MRIAKNQKNIAEIQILGRRTREYMINAIQCPPFQEMKIQLAGISWASKDFRFERRCPSNMQVLIGVKGKGHVWMNGQWRICRPGWAYVTPAGPSHAYWAEQGWQLVWVILSPAARLVLPDRPTLREMNPEPLLHIIHGLHLEVSRRASETALEHWSQLLWEELTELVETPHSRLWPLWREVQKDPGEDWTLEKLARTAKLGTENLRLICQRELGRSPVGHVAHLRMQHASSLLRAGHKAEFVARCVGYEDPFAFSRAFKRVMGVSPRQMKVGMFGK